MSVALPCQIFAEIAAHRVVTGGFFLVALFLGVAIGACVGVFGY
jgi:hypothetical protein